MSEEEAKALFHELDSDRDGALGAEDLLRGAPIVGKILFVLWSTTYEVGMNAETFEKC